MRLASSSSASVSDLVTTNSMFAVSRIMRAMRRVCPWSRV